ncbi:hypothetical protein X765_11695 [Mesorhizobium sp. LSHC440B00]|nr:hypothetical protein X765_11695 [Mesorhizobium sp. LSHC440B00]
MGGRRAGPFDLVVDASGSRSKLRRCLNDPAQPRQLTYGAFWASLGGAKASTKMRCCSATTRPA